MKITVDYIEKTKELFRQGFVTSGKVYEVINQSVSLGWIDIIDDTGEPLTIWENEWTLVDESNLEGFKL